MRPAQATRFNSQLWVGSTAGDERSFYWYGKVLSGRAQIERGTPSRVAYFEWSIPEDADIEDEDVWWEFMPALGYTITPEFVRGELERSRRKVNEGGESLWRRAYGNQWVRVPPLGDTLGGPITLARWAELKDEDSEPAGSPSTAIDVSPDMKWTSVMMAGRRADGLLHVEFLRRQPWTDWVVGWATVNSRYAPFRIAATGPGGFLIPLLEEAGVPVVSVPAQEVTQACARLISAVAEGGIRHLGGNEIPAALSNATIVQRGDSQSWSRVKSSGDISVLVAATIAVGGVVESSPADLRIW